MRSFFWFWMSVAVTMGVSGCKQNAPVADAPVQNVVAHVVAASLAEVPLLERATGSLHAQQSAMLSAQIMGRVQKVLVREGDVVHAGQTLIVLDDAMMRSASEQAEAGVKAAAQQQAAAEANAALAASTLARYRQLEAQKSVSPQEMDEVARRAEAAAAQANALKLQTAALYAQLGGARVQQDYARIRAPFAGVITARMADPGAMAAPGVPLLQIDGSGALELQTTIPESQIATLHKGVKRGVTVDSLGGQGFEGVVSEVLPAADAMSHSFLVKIALPAAKHLHAGLAASAAIHTGTRQAVLAPRSAIVQRGSLSCVYALDASGVARLRTITTGNEVMGKMEVLSGLSGNEKLVDQPGDRELAGRRIEVQP